jgi:hypothetical protein
MAQTDIAQDLPAVADTPLVDVSTIDYDADYPEAEDIVRRYATAALNHYYAHGTPAVISDIAGRVGEVSGTVHGRLSQLGITIIDLHDAAGVPRRSDIVAQVVHDYLDHIGLDRAIVRTRRLKRYTKLSGTSVGLGLQELESNKDGCADRAVVGDLSIGREANTDIPTWIADRQSGGGQ